MKMPFFYAKDQGEEEKLSASHNIKNGQNYGSTFLRSCLNEKDVENDISCINTVFENYRKSLIQHCERSELRLHF